MRPVGVTLVALALAAAAPGRGAAQAPVCLFRGLPEALAERASPLDSVSIPLGDPPAKLCYGRPSAGGVPRVGAELPYGSTWQMGANEPTTLHLPFAARVGSVDLEPGTYTLYAIPEAGDWLIVVNGNPHRWGTPIGPEVRVADIGSFTLTPTPSAEYVDRLTFRFEPAGEGRGSLVYAWERTVLSIPIERR